MNVEPTPAATDTAPATVSIEAARQELLAECQAMVERSAGLAERVRAGEEPDLGRDVLALLANSKELRALVDGIPGLAQPETVAGWDAPTQSRLRHDLRSQLTPLLGCCELWLEEEESPGLSALLPEFQGIQEAGRRCLALIDRLFGGTTAAGEPAASARGAAAIEQLVHDLHQRPTVLVLTGNVLVVDDNEFNRNLLARRLQDEGHTVALAADGRQALALLEETIFELVLLDMIMPEMHGFTVLERMKADARLREIPVIMISGLKDTDVVASCIERGAEDYLVKPFNQVLLRARINACLEKKRLRDREQSYLQQIERERKRADDLLNVILPREIAAELMATDTVKPRRYENVAILFADIVGFTPYCDARPPEEVVMQLQRLVEAWEELALVHDVEKIKTIGDAFMAASGLLAAVENPVLNCVRCGLDMIATTTQLGSGRQLRVGIHIGSVVAGKLGGRQYSFDLWGDTVNTAARMESHGLPGAITLSMAAWQHVAQLCSTSDAVSQLLRGQATPQQIIVKGKGLMDVVRFQGLSG